MPSQPNGYSRVELAQHAGWDRRPADAVEAVAAGDHVALELVRGRRRARSVTRGRSVSRSCDARRRSTSNSSGSAAVEPRGDQVLDDLRLAVDRRSRLPVSSSNGDPVALAVELQLDAVVDDALARASARRRPASRRAGRRVPARARPRGRAPRRTRGSRFSSTTDSIPARCEQVRERQPGRAGADDRRPASARRAAQPRPPPPRRARAGRSRTREFAAGTPQ